MAWYNASWQKRVQISTVSEKVLSDESARALYYDLSQLPSVGFWDTVKSDGSDIRVTTSGGSTEIPLEVVGFNTGTEVGQLYFKGDILSAGDTFYIYFDNASASAYGVSDTYGRNNVWTSYKIVLHGESDSTDSSGNVTPSETGVTSTTGVIGGARQIGTTDADEVSFGNVAWIAGATEVTMSGIFRFNNASRDNTILSKGTFAATEPLLIWRDDAAFASGRTDTISVLFGDGTDKRIEGATGSGPSGTNLHIFTNFLANNATGLHLVINGTEDANSPLSTVGLTALKTNTSNLVIGGVVTTSGRSMDGWFDEFRLANADLGINWGTTEYNNLMSNATFWTTGSVESQPSSYTSPFPSFRR